MAFQGIALLEEFKLATLIGYVKNLPEPIAYRGSEFLPATNIDDVNFEYIVGAYHRPVMASIMAWDSEAPIAGKKGFTKVAGELPPIKRKVHVEEKELIRFYRPRVGTGERQQAIDDVYNLIDDMVNAVRARMEWLRWQALSTGTLVYNSGGINFSIDFIVPSSQKETLAGTSRWSDTTNSVPVDDFQRWINAYVATNGIKPGRAVMSLTSMNYLLQNASIRQLITNYTTQYISEAQLAQLFATFGFPMPSVYDALYDEEADSGVVTTSRFLAEDVVLLLPPPAYVIGQILVGPTAEALVTGAPATGSAKPEGVFVSVYETEEPPSVWIKASATAFPTLPGAQLIGIYNVW